MSLDLKALKAQKEFSFLCAPDCSRNRAHACEPEEWSLTVFLMTATSS
jgi:hypothetical protein